MNRDHAREAFASYVRAYDPRNPRIALKIEHTYRVAELCERIAQSLEVSADEVDLAWLAGLLHDIGRFEQVRRYDTFNDGISVNHATFGAKLLFEQDESAGTHTEQLIRRFVPDASHDELLRTAVATHSDYRLPQELDAKTLRLCNILRDADKIDILKVNVICPIKDIYNVGEDAMRQSAVSDACVRTFYEHRCLPRGIRSYPADIMLGHICFAWELVYDESCRIVAEQGCLAQMLQRTWTDEHTQAQFDQMAQHLDDAFFKRCGVRLLPVRA